MSADYDPTKLDLGGCRADIALLRAQGVTNMPDRYETLLREFKRAREQAYDEGWDARNAAGDRDVNSNPYRVVLDEPSFGDYWPADDETEDAHD